MPDERTGVERVAGTASLVAGVAWSIGALIYALSPLLYNSEAFTGSETAAFAVSAVLPPLLGVAWSRSQWSGARWADWALSAAAVVLVAALPLMPVLGLVWLPMVWREASTYFGVRVSDRVEQ